MVRYFTSLLILSSSDGPICTTESVSSLSIDFNKRYEIKLSAIYWRLQPTTGCQWNPYGENTWTASTHGAVSIKVHPLLKETSIFSRKINRQPPPNTHANYKFFSVGHSYPLFIDVDWLKFIILSQFHFNSHRVRIIKKIYPKLIIHFLKKLFVFCLNFNFAEYIHYHIKLTFSNLFFSL